MSNVRKFSIAKLSGILVGAALVAAPLSGGGPAFAATGCGIGQNVGSCLGAQTEGSGQWQPAAISLQTITSAGTVSITGCQGQLKFLKNDNLKSSKTANQIPQKRQTKILKNGRPKSTKTVTQNPQGNSL
jgi:hypothetical protein